MLDYFTYPFGLYVKLYYNVVSWIEKFIHHAICIQKVKKALILSFLILNQALFNTLTN
jgi:hypothetical protein